MRQAAANSPRVEMWQKCARICHVEKLDLVSIEGVSMVIILSGYSFLLRAEAIKCIKAPFGPFDQPAAARQIRSPLSPSALPAKRRRPYISPAGFLKQVNVHYRIKPSSF